MRGGMEWLIFIFNIYQALDIIFQFSESTAYVVEPAPYHGQAAAQYHPRDSKITSTLR